MFYINPDDLTKIYYFDTSIYNNNNNINDKLSPENNFNFMTSNYTQTGNENLTNYINPYIFSKGFEKNLYDLSNKNQELNSNINQNTKINTKPKEYK